MAALMLLSALGLILSAAAHAATFFPASPISEAAWMLNLGLCVVWTPLLWLGTQRIFDIVNVGNKWTMIPRHAPEWSKSIGVVLLAYAVFNFLFTMLVLNRGGFPALVDGRMVLQTYNFGVILAELTPAQFRLHQAYLVRATSGHWMFFYYMGILAAHSHLRDRQLARRAAPARVAESGLRAEAE